MEKNEQNEKKGLSTTTSHELTRTVEQESNETSVTTMAVKARAEVESYLIMAKKFPRNEEDIRTKVLKTCRIPSFAERAKYKKPQGKIKNEKTGQWEQNFIIGPSVRLAEELFRQWGNIIFDSTVMYEDAQRRIVAVKAIDLQTLAATSGQFIVEKTTERKNATGREVISERLNTAGERVFTLVALDDENFSKQNNIGSKYRRNLIIQLIPTYILQDALEAIDATIKSGIKENPEKAKNEIIDSFSKIGVLPSDLEKYLGHPMAQILPDEISELKDIFTAIIEKETTWVEVMEERKNAEIKEAPVSASFKPGDAKDHVGVTDPIKQDDLATLKAKVGDSVYYEVLAKFGIKIGDKVPDDKIKEIVTELNWK